MKLYSNLVIVVSVCLYRGTVSELAVTNDGCGTTKTCRYFPENCDFLDYDCRFLSWSKSDNPESIDFEIRSARKTETIDYIAFALGTKPEMNDADMYYCTDEEFGTGTILKRYDPPEVLPLENGLTSEGNGVLEGRIHCKFTRPLSISKYLTDGNEYNFNLTSAQYHILMAQGIIDAGTLNYHTWKHFTTEKVDFVKDFNHETLKTPVRQPQAAPQTTPEPDSIKTTPQPEQSTTKSQPKPESTTGEQETTTSGSASTFTLTWSAPLLMMLTHILMCNL